MTDLRQRLFSILIVSFILINIFSVAPAAAFQTTGVEARAANLLAQMTPQEKIGQLFLVSFEGTDVSEESLMYQMIANYHIGGVILSAEHNNFDDTEDIVTSTWALTSELQRAKWQASQTPQTLDDTSFTPVYAPLFIGIEQDGSGPVGDELLSGITPLPNQLALGATWNPDLTYQVGEVLGGELNSLGINLLIGPSLDVAEEPSAERTGDLGTHTFGGDPYWVALMGSAYIRGIHDGSSNSIMIVGQHFPGYTGSDRPLAEEVPTIRKSLEQLQQIELPPFFAVTDETSDPVMQVDALLLSHIRYQGFQGNIRITTRPFSFDPEAVTEVLALPEIAGWHANYGLFVSDDLGTRAVRRFYDPTEETFTTRLVVRDAFLAGNDLLNMNSFPVRLDSDNTQQVIETIEFFTQKYREDVAFAERVDNAVFRILVNKYQLYDTFLLNNVLPAESRLFRVGDAEQIGFEAARQAATLFSPAAGDLNTVLPAPPALGEQIVIFTDSVAAQQCSTCELRNYPESDALGNALISLYGENAGGLLRVQDITSYTFDDLGLLLDDPVSAANIQVNINRAEWVIFLVQTSSAGDVNANQLRRFLSERADLIQNKNVVAFSLGAPYYLDATSISRLTAYFGLYSNQPQFIEVAARLLFKELPVRGASPVTISGIGYDLIQATSPNPQQNLTVGLPDDNGLPVNIDDPSLPLSAQLGDTIDLVTNTIVDFNNHAVPDNTPVRFIISTNNDGVISQREVVVTTSNGSAQISLTVETPGLLEVQAFTGDANQASSNVLAFSVPSEGDTPFVVVTATAAAGALPLPLDQADPFAGDGALDTPARTTLGHWMLSVLLTLFVALLAYQSLAQDGGLRWGIRAALSAILGGQFVNAYLAFEFPGVLPLLESSLIWGVVLATLFGALAGWLFSYFWRMLTR